MMTPKTPTPHSQFVNHANGQRTHFIVDDFTDPWKKKNKDTQAVLIQHGFGRHSAFWYHWIPRLASRYRVVRRDLRGHGLSSDPTPDYDYSLDVVLGEIVDLLDQLGIVRVHLLCESTGGMIGVAFAARHPDRLHSLSVCATPTHIVPAVAQRTWALGYASWPAACRELGARGFCDAVARLPGGAGNIGQPDHPDDPDHHDWWLDQVGLSTGEGLARYAEFLLFGLQLDVRPLMKHIKCPVLILAPTRSRNTNMRDQEAFRDAVAGGAQLVPIDGMGHEIYVDKAEESQQVFLEFLSRVSI